MLSAAISPLRAPAAISFDSPAICSVDEVDLGTPQQDGGPDLFASTFIGDQPARSCQVAQPIHPMPEDNSLHAIELPMATPEEFATPAISRSTTSTTSSNEIGEKIMSILERYRMTPRDSHSLRWAARNRFLKSTVHSIEHQAEIRLTLPAFPFKSPNKAAKVLGDLPDCGEETALLHLDGMCQAINEVYNPGAKLYLVSDGLMYNDLLGVSDHEVWTYGQALRKLGEEHGCHNIRFIRLVELLGRDILTEPLSEAEYLRDAPKFRDELYHTYIPEDFNADAFIASEQDAMLTYRGYLKFLEVDLENKMASLEVLSKAQTKRNQEEVAKNMIRRGKAFANAISSTLSSYIRLSIHPSTEATKLSVTIVPQLNNSAMTPWHSSVVRALDGSITMSHALRVPAKTHDLIFEGGRPSYFRERSPLFDWSLDVEFRYMYPCGILIIPRDPSSRCSLHSVHMQKLRKLAEQCSPVILRGFRDTMDHHTFVAKAYDAGQPVLSPGLVSSSIDRHGEYSASDPTRIVDQRLIDRLVQESLESSRFLYMVSLSDSAQMLQQTLFASSRLFWQHLPPKQNVEGLSKLTWTYKVSEDDLTASTNIPLVVPHPTDVKRLCVRWYNLWYCPEQRDSKLNLKIENGSQYYIALIDSMLSDRRVCLYFSWERGDVVISDNIATMHSHSQVTPEQFWQIGLN